MFGRTKNILVGAALVLSGAVLLSAQTIQGVPLANPRSGHPANDITPEFKLQPIVTGSDALENPSGVITQFGFLNDFPPQVIEATKTEPDENTYVVFRSNPGGPTAGYNYGRHFLYQGHEVFGQNLAYVTRINLDVTDPAHRITLLTPVGSDGQTHLTSIDGSTFDAFTRSLLFTQEAGGNGGVVEVSTGWPATVRTFDGILGKGGYEGIHPDGQGNLLIIEDVGGSSVNVNPADPNSPKNARRPNSFVYRFVPQDITDLSKGGQLQALQVTINGKPLVFGPDAVADTFAPEQVSLHTPGTSWPVQWVTINDSRACAPGCAAFSANAAAKAAGATPFKRPENAQFVPGTNFRSFVFDTTGDTNANSGNVPELAARGAWGALFRVDFPRRRPATISIIALGDAAHAAFDNVAFVSDHLLLAAEDRGDTLHKQLNTLDSIWLYDICDGSSKRFLALGRDPLSEIDAAFLDAATPGYQNDGDNEPTGVHVSEGKTSIGGLLGRDEDLDDARWFFTQQHGQNTVFEILRNH